MTLAGSEGGRIRGWLEGKRALGGAPSAAASRAKVRPRHEARRWRSSRIMVPR